MPPEDNGIKRRDICCLALAVALFCLLLIPRTQESPTRQIILMRHAEKISVKANGKEHWEHSNLSRQGYLRSDLLPFYFQHPPSHGIHQPNRLYAMKTCGASQRAIETVRPLSSRLGAPLKADYCVDETSHLAASVLAELDGTSLICWEFAHIPQIAYALGLKWITGWNYNPEHHSAGIYDMVWVIDFVKQKPVHLNVFKTFDVPINPTDEQIDQLKAWVASTHNFPGNVKAPIYTRNLK